jgi:hypothetical protein
MKVPVRQPAKIWKYFDIRRSMRSSRDSKARRLSKVLACTSRVLAEVFSWLYIFKIYWSLLSILCLQG